MVRTVDVAARTGEAVDVRAGDRVAVIDVAGQQVADLWCVLSGGLEALSVSRTRTLHRRLFLRVGDVLVTNRRRPVLRLAADSSPGDHDLLCPPCGPEYYRDQGFEGWHPSCEENARLALERRGLHMPLVPDAVNLFQRTPVAIAADGAHIEFRDARTRAGDAVVLDVLVDAVVVVSACAVDHIETNGRRCTPIRLEISGE